jgi:hypothetical protein
MAPGVWTVVVRGSVSKVGPFSTHDPGDSHNGYGMDKRVVGVIAVKNGHLVAMHVDEVWHVTRNSVPAPLVQG